MDWFLYDNGLHHERVTKKNNKNKKYTYDKLSVMRLITNKKNPNKLDTAVWSCCSKRLLWGISCFTIPICDSVSKFNDGAKEKYQELIRRIMTLEYEKLQLLKSPQNEVVPNIEIILEKRKTSQRYHIYLANFEIKLRILRFF